MKLSVSLPDEDVAFLDEYAETNRAGSRSAALQRAVTLLRASTLETAYEAALEEWEDSGEAELWDRTVGDGIAG